MLPIERAVRILRGGGLVAFPTETVYGLGADATNAAAVRRVFAVKGRPANNPLIVHVADAATARRFAADWPIEAQKLAAALWPGPITLVVAKSASIVPEATAGLQTVGLRSPDHPIALELLREFDGPLVGPSANPSERISPTTAQHVQDELGDRVDLILDGGPCRVGIESTVLDLSRRPISILRLGGMSRQRIEAIVGPVQAPTGSAAANEAAASPGQQAVHYAPRSPAFRFERIESAVAWCGDHPADAAVILTVGSAPAQLRRAISPQHELIEMPDGAGEYARRLYAALHAADAKHLTAIWIQLPPATEADWAAVRDRIERATRITSSPGNPGED